MSVIDRCNIVKPRHILYRMNAINDSLKKKYSKTSVTCEAKAAARCSDIEVISIVAAIRIKLSK